MTLDELFERHEAIALDSNVLIYLLEDAGVLADAAQAIIDGLDAGRANAAISSIALTEVLAGPAVQGDVARMEQVDADLWSIGGVTLVPVDRRIAVEAARARGEGRTLADAIHMATAKLSEATAFVTNDHRIRSRDGIEVIRLSDIEVPVTTDQKDAAPGVPGI